MMSLIKAVETGNVKLVRAVLAAGADVHAMDDEALRDAANQGHTEVVKLLKGAIR